MVIAGKLQVINHVPQELVYVSNEHGKLVEISNMISNSKFVPPVLIFLQSKQRVAELYSIIGNKKIPVATLAADKSKEEREKVVEGFRSGAIWALICSDVAARGLDFKGVQTVINYDMPNSVVNYIHKVGRTGRTGSLPGKAYTFFTDDDKPLLRSIGNLLKSSGCPVAEWIFKLKKTTKQEIKKIGKVPVKRRSIATKEPKDELNKGFAKAMKKRDKKMKKWILKPGQAPPEEPEQEEDEDQSEGSGMMDEEDE